MVMLNFFGEKRNWYIKSFDLESIMVDNYIDVCAIFLEKRSNVGV
jgi:hypothetical protein